MRNKLPTQLLHEHLNKRIIGVVRSYSKSKGYGFIYTHQTRDVFVSSFDIGKNIEKKIRIGVIVSFVLKEKENSRICATDIRIIDNPRAKNLITLPNGSVLRVAAIEDFVKINVNEGKYKTAISISYKHKENSSTNHEKIIFYDNEIYNNETLETFRADDYYRYLMESLCGYDEAEYLVENEIDIH